MSYIPSPEQAKELVMRYNKEAFHIQHAETVSQVMGELARKFDPENVDFWRTVGMLHDIDFELYPEQHCVKAVELLEKAGFDGEFIHAVTSHGWGMTDSAAQPEHEMEKVLFAADELTGLIWAAALMRPSKSVQDMEVKSVKKKFKSANFAAGCSREVIRQGADMLGWELADLIEKTILAMRSCETSVAEAMKVLEESEL